MVLNILTAIALMLILVPCATLILLFCLDIYREVRNNWRKWIEEPSTAIFPLLATMLAGVALIFVLAFYVRVNSATIEVKQIEINCETNLVDKEEE